MTRSLILIAFLAVSSAGCASLDGADGPVGVRVANESDVPFDRVIVGFPRERVDYGAVAAGDEAEYRFVEIAYRYAYVEVHVGDEVVRLQPVDYVGETPLDRGLYTYALGVDTGLTGLSLTLRRGDG